MAAPPASFTVYFYGTDKIGGDAPVKPEFLISQIKTSDESAPTSSTTTTTNNDSAAPETEHTEDKGKKRDMGRKNKQKAKKQRITPRSGICLKMASGDVCPYGEKYALGCKFSHDSAAFLATKEADLGEICYMFSTYGFCPYGLSCRYGNAHIKDGKHIVNEELLAKTGKPKTINLLSRDSQVQLRDNRREYPKSIPIIKKYSSNQPQQPKATASTPKTQESTPKEEPTPKEQEPTLKEQESIPKEQASTPSTTTTSTTTTTTTTAETTNVDSVPPKTTIEFPPEIDKETKLKPEEKKKVDFKGKLYLAPLTTNGNLPFRRICKRLGADITCGEMALVSNLLHGQASEWALLRRHPSEDVFGIQLAGAFVDQMTKCAELIEQENLDVDFVDINSGCPIDIVVNKGMGSALLEKPRRMQNIVRSMSEVLSRPLTIKIRTGRDDKSPVAHEIIPELKLWGAEAVTLHGRNRVQRYSKVANWDYINACAKISPIPLIGNGDVYNWEEAVHYMENTSISSLMIARSAIIKPWIFTEIKERRHWDITANERFDILRDFSNYGLEHWGSDSQGVEKTRNFLLNWISFLCRYVPVGLLERLPSRINERPPNFSGRSDLETMLGSKKVGDWVKLSEMLLGPVPESFHFEPKHKSNSYDDAQG